MLRLDCGAVFTGHRRDGKQMLANSPRKPLPQEILQRKKTGLTVPINDWLEREHKEVPHSFGMRPWALFLWQNFLTAR
jgi:hypothetical protein